MDCSEYQKREILNLFCSEGRERERQSVVRAVYLCGIPSVLFVAFFSVRLSISEFVSRVGAPRFT